MSSENRSFYVLATLAAAGAGFAASMTKGWFDELLGYNDFDNKTNDAPVVVHQCSFKEILIEHERRQTIVSRYTTLEICNEYKEHTTFFGFTLKDALKAGLWGTEETSNTIGILAGDGDVYTLFPKVLNPLIEFVHGSHPKAKYKSSIDDRDFEYNTLDVRYVLSCRVRALRSLRGFPFAWLCSENERQEIEETAEGVLRSIPGYPTSPYVKLSELDKETRDLLLMNNYVFNPYVNKADQTWPSGRGIWYGDQGNALVLVNEQEHLKFITQQTGCDVNSAFRRLRYIVDMTEQLLWENAHEFSFDDDFGHLTSSPREIGTGFRVSINVRLPRLSQEPRLAFILHVLSLEKRQPGIITQNSGGVMELSNSTRTGHKEVEFVQHVVSGIHYLITMEKLLEDGHVIDPVLCEIIR